MPHRTGLADFNRIMGNFWTAVFERPVRKFNRPLRGAITQSDTVVVTEDSLTLDFNVPTSRYYEDMTQTGVDQLTGGGEESLWGGDESNYMSYPASVFDNDSDQMWIFMFIQPQWASAEVDDQWMFEWFESAGQHLRIFWDGSVGQFKLSRNGTEAGVSNTHASGDDISICAQLTNASIILTLDDATATLTVDVPAGVNGEATFYLGTDEPNTAGIEVTGFHWVVMGIGTLTAADITALHALGVAGPTTWQDLPIGTFQTMDPSFLWEGVDKTHLPTVHYGEGRYE